MAKAKDNIEDVEEPINTTPVQETTPVIETPVQETTPVVDKQPEVKDKDVTLSNELDPQFRGTALLPLPTLPIDKPSEFIPDAPSPEDEEEQLDEDVLDKISRYAKLYPQNEAFHITSDGQVFLHVGKRDAEKHEKTLGEGKIKSYQIH